MNRAVQYIKTHFSLSKRVKELERITGSREWYYYVDLGYGVRVGKEHRKERDGGLKNWNGFLKNMLPELKGCRILDIGCNAGLYALEMSRRGAVEVVGLDLDVRKAEFVRDWFAVDRHENFSNVRFIGCNATEFDLKSLGTFDLVCMFCVAYHLGPSIDHVFDQLSSMTEQVALQGNLPRLVSRKYAKRPHQHLAGVDGMKDLLLRHGFSEMVVSAPERWQKPLVLGRKATSPGSDGKPRSREAEPYAKAGEWGNR